MADYKAPVADLKFLLNDVFNAPDLWARLGINDADSDTASAILDEAAKLCETVIAPLNRSSDEQGCELTNGVVEAPLGFKEAYQAYCDGGWGALGGDPEYEGMGMPKSLVACIEEMLQGACMSFGLAPMLTAGACLALNAHGSDRLKEWYLPKMYSGQWAGAMDLTEPHAGTDLGLMRTKAEPVGSDSLGDAYAISGTKIFITWGEHEMAENIVHLVLAKLPDAPAGSKGISLFLVPKYLSNPDGTLGQRNQYSCGALEKKMGIKGSATCVMNFDGARGWLVGEPNKGLAAMFTMMNYERLTVGIQALAAAEASYQNASEYAKDRLQSRALSGVKSPDQPADPIIEHGDVRRMLLHMRSFNEAGRAFYLYVAQYLDRAKFAATTEERNKATARVALLTPVAKAFMSDMALSAAVEGQQVFGGHGYIREWGQEQYVRDIRITQIYEGTNGIQALDLLGRKIVADGGATLADYCHDIVLFSGQSLPQVLRPFGAKLIEQCEVLQAIAENICETAKKQPDVISTHANDFLHFLGLVSYGYLWLKIAEASLNYKGESQSVEALSAKMHVCRYFFERELPRTHLLVERLRGNCADIMSMPSNLF